MTDHYARVLQLIEELEERRSGMTTMLNEMDTIMNDLKNRIEAIKTQVSAEIYDMLEDLTNKIETNRAQVLPSEVII